MDEIQRSLRASLEADRGAAAREAFFRNLPKDAEALSFWLSMAVRLSQHETWWYDTLAALVRRYLRSREWREKRELPGVLVGWCAGVAAREIRRPRGRGRPTKHMRDALICAAVEAYLEPGPGNEGCALGEACARVADAACIDERVARKIWRRSQAGISRPYIWKLIGQGAFPRPLHLGKRARAWRSDEIDAWIEARTAERDRRTNGQIGVSVEA